MTALDRLAARLVDALIADFDRRAHEAHERDDRGRLLWLHPDGTRTTGAP